MSENFTAGTSALQSPDDNPWTNGANLRFLELTTKCLESTELKNLNI